MTAPILKVLFIVLFLAEFMAPSPAHAGGRAHYTQRRASAAHKKERYRREAPIGTEGFDPLLYNEHISPHGFCEELLTSWDTVIATQSAAIESDALLQTLVPVTDVPGLFVLPEVFRKFRNMDLRRGVMLAEMLEIADAGKKFHRHELISGARYATFINRAYGQKLILTPCLSMVDSKNGSVPGFDGLILSREGRVISNFSLKTAEIARNPKKAAAKAIDSVKQFSYVEGWLAYFGLLKMRTTPELVSLDQIPAPRRKHNIKRIEQAYRLFGFSSTFISRRVRRPRSARIFVDMEDHLPMEIYDKSLQSIQEKIKDSDQTVLSVTIAHNGVTYIVTGHDITQLGERRLNVQEHEEHVLDPDVIVISEDLGPSE